MKYIIGIIITLIILTLGAYFTLDLWGVEMPITEEELKKGLLTVAIVGGVFLLLLVVVPFFFKNQNRGYDKTRGKVAHPRNKD